MLIVTSAGNNDNVESPRLKEEFRESSIEHPGTAKNTLTLGASETLRPLALWPRSGRGPTQGSGKRLKPDILAPGTAVVGPKS
jgi:hypothetical protein